MKNSITIEIRAVSEKTVPLFNHDPKTAPVIGHLEKVDGKPTVKLVDPYDKDHKYTAYSRMMQTFFDS